MFRKPVTAIKQGDRAGICVAQLDAELIERGLAATPRSVKTTDLAILVVRRIPYFPGEIKSKQKFHLSIGNSTAVGEITLFSCAELQFSINKNSLKTVNSIIKFDYSKEYKAEEILPK